MDMQDIGCVEHKTTQASLFVEERTSRPSSRLSGTCSSYADIAFGRSTPVLCWDSVEQDSEYDPGSSSTANISQIQEKGQGDTHLLSQMEKRVDPDERVHACEREESAMMDSSSTTLPPQNPSLKSSGRGTRSRFRGARGVIDSRRRMRADRGRTNEKQRTVSSSPKRKEAALSFCNIGSGQGPSLISPRSKSAFSGPVKLESERKRSPAPVWRTDSDCPSYAQIFFGEPKSFFPEDVGRCSESSSSGVPEIEFEGLSDKASIAEFKQEFMRGSEHDVAVQTVDDCMVVGDKVKVQRTMDDVFETMNQFEFEKISESKKDKFEAVTWKKTDIQPAKLQNAVEFKTQGETLECSPATSYAGILSQRITFTTTEPGPAIKTVRSELKTEVTTPGDTFVDKAKGNYLNVDEPVIKVKPDAVVASENIFQHPTIPGLILKSKNTSLSATLKGNKKRKSRSRSTQKTDEITAAVECEEFAIPLPPARPVLDMSQDSQMRCQKGQNRISRKGNKQSKATAKDVSVKSKSESSRSAHKDPTDYKSTDFGVLETGAGNNNVDLGKEIQQVPELRNPKSHNKLASRSKEENSTSNEAVKIEKLGNSKPHKSELNLTNPEMLIDARISEHAVPMNTFGSQIVCDNQQKQKSKKKKNNKKSKKEGDDEIEKALKEIEIIENRKKCLVGNYSEKPSTLSKNLNDCNVESEIALPVFENMRIPAKIERKNSKKAQKKKKHDSRVQAGESCSTTADGSKSERDACTQESKTSTTTIVASNKTEEMKFGSELCTLKHVKDEMTNSATLSFQTDDSWMNILDFEGPLDDEGNDSPVAGNETKVNTTAIFPENKNVKGTNCVQDKWPSFSQNVLMAEVPSEAGFGLSSQFVPQKSLLTISSPITVFADEGNLSEAVLLGEPCQSKPLAQEIISEMPAGSKVTLTKENNQNSANSNKRGKEEVTIKQAIVAQNKAKSHDKKNKEDSSELCTVVKSSIMPADKKSKDVSETMKISAGVKFALQKVDSKTPLFTKKALETTVKNSSRVNIDEIKTDCASVLTGNSRLHSQEPEIGLPKPETLASSAPGLSLYLDSTSDSWMDALDFEGPIMDSDDEKDEQSLHAVQTISQYETQMPVKIVETGSDSVILVPMQTNIPEVLALNLSKVEQITKSGISLKTDDLSDAWMDVLDFEGPILDEDIVDLQNTTMHKSGLKFQPKTESSSCDEPLPPLELCNSDEECKIDHELNVTIDSSMKSIIRKELDLMAVPVPNSSLHNYKEDGTSVKFSHDVTVLMCPKDDEEAASVITYAKLNEDANAANAHAKMKEAIPSLIYPRAEAARIKMMETDPVSTSRDECSLDMRAGTDRYKLHQNPSNLTTVNKCNHFEQAMVDTNDTIAGINSWMATCMQAEVNWQLMLANEKEAPRKTSENLTDTELLKNKATKNSSVNFEAPQLPAKKLAEEQALNKADQLFIKKKDSEEPIRQKREELLDIETAEEMDKSIKAKKIVRIKKAKAVKKKQTVNEKNKNNGTEQLAQKKTADELDETKKPQQHTKTKAAEDLEKTKKAKQLYREKSYDQVAKQKANTKLVENKKTEKLVNKNKEAEHTSKNQDVVKSAKDIEAAELAEKTEAEELANKKEAELANKREAELANKREAELANKREAELANQREANELTKKRETVELAKKREAEDLAKKREAEEFTKNREAEKLAKKKGAEELAKKKEAEELAKKKEAEELARKKEAEELAEKNEAEELTKNREAEDLAKKKEAEKLAQKREAEELAQKREAEELAQKREAEELAQKREAEELAQKREAEELAKKREAEDLTKNREAEKLAKKKEAEELAKKKVVEELAKNKEAEELAKKKEAEELAKKKEAEELANKKEAEELAKKKEAEDLAKKREAEDLTNNREAEKLAKKKEAEELAKKKEAEELAKKKEAEELAKKKEAEELAKKKEAEELTKNREAEDLAKNKEAEELAQKREAEELAQKREAEELAQKREAEELAQKREAEELAQKREAEELAQKREAEELAKKREAEDLTKNREAEKLAKKKEAEELAKKKVVEELAKNKEAEELTKKKEAEELAKKKEAEELAKKKEAEELAQKREAEELAKKREAEELAKKREGEELAKKKVAEELAEKKKTEDLASKEKLEKLSRNKKEVEERAAKKEVGKFATNEEAGDSANRKESSKQKKAEELAEKTEAEELAEKTEAEELAEKTEAEESALKKKAEEFAKINEPEESSEKKKAEEYAKKKEAEELAKRKKNEKLGKKKVAKELSQNKKAENLAKIKEAEESAANKKEAVELANLKEAEESAKKKKEAKESAIKIKSEGLVKKNEAKELTVMKESEKLGKRQEAEELAKKKEPEESVQNSKEAEELAERTEATESATNEEVEELANMKEAKKSDGKKATDQLAKKKAVHKLIEIDKSLQLTEKKTAEKLTKKKEAETLPEKKDVEYLAEKFPQKKETEQKSIDELTKIKEAVELAEAEEKRTEGKKAAEKLATEKEPELLVNTKQVALKKRTNRMTRNKETGDANPLEIKMEKAMSKGINVSPEKESNEVSLKTVTINRGSNPKYETNKVKQPVPGNIAELIAPDLNKNTSKSKKEEKTENIEPFGDVSNSVACVALLEHLNDEPYKQFGTTEEPSLKAPEDEQTLCGTSKLFKGRCGKGRRRDKKSRNNINSIQFKNPLFSTRCVENRQKIPKQSIRNNLQKPETCSSALSIPEYATMSGSVPLDDSALKTCSFDAVDSFKNSEQISIEYVAHVCAPAQPLCMNDDDFLEQINCGKELDSTFLVEAAQELTKKVSALTRKINSPSKKATTSKCANLPTIKAANQVSGSARTKPVETLTLDFECKASVHSAMTDSNLLLLLDYHEAEKRWREMEQQIKAALPVKDEQYDQPPPPPSSDGSGSYQKDRDDFVQDSKGKKSTFTEFLSSDGQPRCWTDWSTYLARDVVVQKPIMALDSSEKVIDVPLKRSGNVSAFTRDIKVK